MTTWRSLILLASVQFLVVEGCKICIEKKKPTVPTETSTDLSTVSGEEVPKKPDKVFGPEVVQIGKGFPINSEKNCYDNAESGTKVMSRIKYTYYRGNEYQDCEGVLDECLEDDECTAVEVDEGGGEEGEEERTISRLEELLQQFHEQKNKTKTTKCYKVITQYSLPIVSKTTRGHVWMKAEKCFGVLPDLVRVRRQWSQYFHTFGVKTRFERFENSGICYAANVSADCDMIPFGSSKNGKIIVGASPDIQLGWCMRRLGECGATEIVTRYKHETREDYVFVPKKHPRILLTPLGFKKQYDVGCYFWPGYMNINCDQIAN